MLNKLASDCYQNVVGFEAEMFLITVISFGFKKAALKKNSNKYTNSTILHETLHKYMTQSLLV